jgi:hypothetical protein
MINKNIIRKLRKEDILAYFRCYLDIFLDKLKKTVTTSQDLQCPRKGTSGYEPKALAVESSFFVRENFSCGEGSKAAGA